jgi:transposase, IS30 family
MNYHQLTQAERYQIEAGVALGLSIQEISLRLGRHRSTLFRELKRNAHMYREGYSALYSQSQYERRRTRCRRKFLIRGGLKKWINERLQIQWSPEQITGRRRIEGRSGIGVETIYRYLYREKSKGSVLWLNLRHARSSGRRRRFKPLRWPKSISRPGLNQRPQVIEKRKRFGDFERDLIVGTQRQGYILTIVDRKTKLTRLVKIKAPRAEEVHQATVAALKRLKVKSITNDNGFEFTNYKQTSKDLKAPIYFTRPYASWERGTVENTNKLIRQYFPKPMNLKEVSRENIKMVEMVLNYRPRKLLGFRTPIEASA